MILSTLVEQSIDYILSLNSLCSPSQVVEVATLYHEVWDYPGKRFIIFYLQGRCQKKKRIYLGLCPKLWVGGSKGGSKVPNFLVKITIQLFLLQTSRNVLKHVIHKWGGHIWPFHDALRPQRFWNFGILSEKFLIFSKK